MASTVQVKLTPVDTATGTYNLELPDNLAARVTHVERPDKTTLLATLIEGEIGADLATPALRIKLSDGNAYRLTLTLDN